MSIPRPKTAVQISLAYGTLAALWILFSDRLLGLLVSDPELLTPLQTVKGWLFVVVTAGILYLLLRESHRGPAPAATPEAAESPARWHGVRWRLAGLVALVFLPLALLTVIRDLERYRADARSVRERLMGLAEWAAAQQNDFLESSRQLLAGPVFVAAATGEEVVAVHGHLAGLLPHYPQYSNLAVVALNGDVIGSALPLPGPVSVADQPWFQRVRDSGEFAIGDYEAGRISRQATLHLAGPCRDADGRLRGVAYAAVNPQWLSRFAGKSALLKGNVVTVVDRQGTILARNVDSQQWIGHSVPEAPLIRAIMSREETTKEVTGLDGIVRVHAFRSVPLSQGSLFVTVGISRAEVYAAAQSQLAGDLQILALVAVLILLASWVFADLFILRHTRRLNAAVQRMSAGDLAARSGVPYDVGELGRFARSFDSMAEALEARTRERQRAEEALRDNEQHFRALIENSSDIVSIVDAAGTFRYLSPSIERVLGYTPPELVGQNAFGFVHPDDLVDLRQAFAESLRSHRAIVSREFRARHRDGSWRHLAGVAQNLLAEKGVEGVVVTSRNVTDRKTAEEALRLSEARYRDLFENMLEGFAYCRMEYDGDRPVDFVYLEVNRAFEELTGLTNVTGRKVSEVLPGLRESDPELFEVYGRVARTGQPERFEFYLQPAKVWLWISVYSPVREFFVAVFDNITERKKAEEALRESEGMFRSLSASSPVGILLFDARGRVTYSNPRCRQILGLSLAETMGEGWLGAVHPDDARRLTADWAAATREGREYRQEFRVPRRPGTDRWVHLRTAPIHEDRTKVTGHVGTLEDITEHNLADQQLRLQSAALQSAANAILITDTEGKIQWVNDAFTRLTGYPAAEAIGQNPRVLKSGQHDEPFYKDLWTSIRSGKVWHGVVVNKRKDGTLYTEEMTITPVRNQREEITHYIAIKEDVTEKHRLEEQFRQSQKMEAVGRLAGGVAHDFNNILTAIIGYNQILLERLDPSSPLIGNAREVETAAHRAAALTRQLLAFSRKQVLLPQILDLNAVVLELGNMLRRLIGEDIHLTNALGESLWPVKVDRNQLEQVIMNLVVNARDAMPGGGHLSLETANIEIDEAYTRSRPDVPAGAYVMLAVTDTGTGMSPEVQARIFEPFFTTKAQGKGTGLGLATCFGIVKQSGGHIAVYSEIGRGTVFKIYLPRAAESAGEIVAEVAAGPPRGGTETILLVEDEPMVRELAAMVLRDLGYTVLEATDGSEAMAVAERQTDTIHVLVTDVVMPQMNGRELADKLRHRHAETKVLFASGYTEDAVIQHGVIEEGVPFLQKPYSPTALARKVRDVLDARPKPRAP